MLTKNNLELLVIEHCHTLKYCTLSTEARAFYATRLELLYFVLEAEGVSREPPTDNATINDYLQSEAGI